MQGAYHRPVLNLVDKLDLVEEEDHAPLLLARRRSELEEEVRQIGSERPLIRLPEVDLKAEALGAHETDRLQVAEAIPHLLHHAVAQLHHREGPFGVAGKLLYQIARRRQLVVVGEEPPTLGQVLEGIQQHSLADAAQALGDHALIGLLPASAGPPRRETARAARLDRQAREAVSQRWGCMGSGPGPSS